MKSLSELKVEMAQAQRIYEPKYGGKDHSGYETLMKYEVNDEREEAFELGFDAGAQAVMERAEKLVEALGKIRSGLTTDQSRVEFETKKLAHEYLTDWANFVKEN